MSANEPNVHSQKTTAGDIRKDKMSMRNFRTTLTLAVLIECLKAGSGTLIQKPQDSDAIVGKSTYFNCSTSQPSKRIQWFRYDVGAEQREAIYRCDNFTEFWYPCYRNGRYIIQRNQAAGSYNLVIPTVVSPDAGRFLCEVDGDEGTANLTVRVESSSSCVHAIAYEDCKPYSTAIICIFLIILPISIATTVFVLWYLRVYRLKKRTQKANKVEETKEEATEPNSSATSPRETEQLLHAPDLTARVIELEKMVEEKNTRINDLTTKLTSKTDEAAEKLQRQSDEMEKLQDRSGALESDNSQLKATVKELYTTRNIDYAEKPDFVHKIITDAKSKEQKPINGIAILGGELFVLLENWAQIEVYDTETFMGRGNWEIEGMLHPMDIASCKTTSCIYVVFLGASNESTSHILKLKTNGDLLTRWSTEADNCRLSIYKSNVIVCLFKHQLIHEYTKDGDEIHTVSLSSAVSLKHPWHAIKVTSSHFAVCQGDTGDELHRVCIVDADGKILKESGKSGTTDARKSSGTLNVPMCLLADSGRSILVADRDNQRIVLLNCFLEYKRSLLRKEKLLDNQPIRICLDETKCLLFVAGNVSPSKIGSEKSSILIFKIA